MALVFGYFCKLLHPLSRYGLALIVEPVQGGVYAVFDTLPIYEYIFEFLFVYGVPVTYELLDGDTQSGGYGL